MTTRSLIAALLSGALLASAPWIAHSQSSAAGPYYAMPSWDQALPPSSRFLILTNFANQAFLDRETGLVWERLVGQTFDDALGAITECTTKLVGGRAGWRLPTASEVMSLVDFSGQTFAAGVPIYLFAPQQVQLYLMTSTVVPGPPADGFAVLYITTNPTTVYVFSTGIVTKGTVLCVRGPQ